MSSGLIKSCVFLISVCSGYVGIHNKQVVKDEQMSASSTLTIEDLWRILNASLDALENDSPQNTTQVKSNYTITGNKTAAHDGRLGNTEGSWCASGDPESGEHHLIVDLGMLRVDFNLMVMHYKWHIKKISFMFFSCKKFSLHVSLRIVL